MEHFLIDHNTSSKAPMELVLFRFAVEHVSRICRVLRQPNGNVLLIGLLLYLMEFFASQFTTKVIDENFSFESTKCFLP